MGSLLDDYLSSEPALVAAYAGAPSTVTSHPIPPRSWESGLVRDMAAYQQLLGSQQVMTGAESVIITGQQPGIFTGPLYTIYKAITAIKLASAISRETGAATVPVYWVGGDDHDFDEISRVYLLTKAHSSIELRLAEAPSTRSIFQIPVPEELHDLVDEAARQAPGSEFREEIRGFLHESLDLSGNLSEWHARLMARLFRDTPLLFFTPELPAARRAAIPVFEQEIRNPLASTARLNEGGAYLESVGYGAQVVKGDDSCNFFVERNGIRCRVRYAEGQFQLLETRETLGQAELLALLHEAPERFTANVALRCLVQQHLFPVRAYVAGPGELAYWGQLKGVFQQFDQPMPIVYPRMRAILTSVKTNKLLKKFGLTPADLSGTAENLEETALRASQNDPALKSFEQHQERIRSAVQAMVQDVEGLGRDGKTALPLVQSFRGHVEQGLDHLERGILRADASRNEAIRSQIARLTTELAPERKPQERYYTIFSWLFQQGWGLIDRLEQALDHETFSVQEVEL